MSVRRFQPADAPAVWDLHNRALLAVGAHAGNGPWDVDLRDVEASYLAAGGEFLVAHRDGRLVAMGGLRPVDRTTAEITRMRVEPDCQRQGLGQAMLDALTTCARERGFRRLVLATTTGQRAARGLYEKNGFTVVDRSRMGRFDVLHYEKSLPEPSVTPGEPGPETRHG